MIGFNQLSMAYGEKLLFVDATLTLSGQKHYALVGANGTGKTTLLRLINGEEVPLSGEISTPKDATIGWLKQDQFRYENNRIIDVVIQGKQELWQAISEKEKLLETQHWDEKTAHKLSRLEDTIAHLNGYSAFSYAEKLLIGLGIPNDYHYQPLNTLSGGYKLRVLLAQVLFQEPDILLLDEPTNHLDILSIHWLEKFLKNEFKGLVLFISHDIEFINRLADKIIDIDYGEIREYSGQYSKFLAEKQLIAEQKLLQQKNIEKKIADMQKFVDRFKAGTRARQTQSRVKLIEKMELPDIKQSSRIAPNFIFKPRHQSGKTVLKVKNIAKNFQSNRLFHQMNFEIHRGEKVAIIGENGVGKSTLLKILLDKIQQDDGEYEWGAETHISYFSQDHHELLTTHINVLAWLEDQVKQATVQQLHRALGQVLFKKDDVEKDIMSLSGGESARLLLAKISLEASNVLILDEPTNHLDIESIDALATALKNYTGTLIFVSHDRHFISKIANHVLFITKQGLLDYKGDFVEFEKLHDL